MKNKVTMTLSFLAGIFLLSSCLKDNMSDYWVDDLAGKVYATIPLNTLQSMALKPVAGEVPFTFMVNIATDALPTEDITVSLIVDAPAVAAYNTSAKKNYKSYPTVSMTTTSLVIKAGTRNGYATGKVWGAETLNACDNYMAAISISSAKTASGKDIAIGGNMKSFLLALPISNPYAADYHTVGYRIRPGNATEPVDATQTFATLDCKTVRKNGFGNYSAFDITIEITANTVVVGGTTCFKVIAMPIDPTTGGSVGGMFDVWTGDPALAPADKTINYYNPAKKQFVLNCWYTSSAGNRIMYEVNTRL
ncbi:MAG: DUF1735 domain-containing protein [Prolixibacteraceae bacterium]